MIYGTSKWKKISNRKLKNTFIFKKCKKWSNFFYFSTCLNSYSRVGKNLFFAIYFLEVQKKLSNFL